MVEGQGAERARELAARLGLRGTLEPEPLGELEHVLTHRHMTVSVYRMTCVRAEASDVMRRVVRDALAELGVSRLTHKILDLAEGDTRR